MTDAAESHQSNVVSIARNQHNGPLTPKASDVDDLSAISSLSLFTAKLAAFNKTETGSHFRMPMILQEHPTVLNEAVSSENIIPAKTIVTDTNGQTFEGLILKWSNFFCLIVRHQCWRYNILVIEMIYDLLNSSP